MSSFLGGSSAGGGTVNQTHYSDYVASPSSGGGGWSSMDTYRTAGALSGLAKSWNQISTARHQGEVAESNVEMMKLEARYQDLRSDIAKRRLRRKTAMLRGSQRAGYSGGNINPDVGSAKEVGEETWEQEEKDEMLIDMGAESAAAGYRSRAADYQYTADTAMSRGMTRAGTSLLSTTRKMRRVR